MATEIIDGEIFLEARRTRWRKIRFVFYLSVFLLILAPPSLPIPLAPEFLHDIFAGRNGGLINVFVTLLFIFSLVVLFFCVSYEFIFRHRLNNLALLEIFAVPALLVALLFLFGMVFDDTPKQLVLINKDKQPEKFSNPFLNYKMLDCRSITEEFDVVFIPAHFQIETEYLAYAPRREDKAIGYKRGKKYGDDWYLDFSGSMWGDNLRKCWMQNKSPNIDIQ